jgi:hypothetical protein
VASSPTHSPPPLSRPAGRKREAFNSPFGRVFKVNEFLSSSNLGLLRVDSNSHANHQQGALEGWRVLAKHLVQDFDPNKLRDTTLLRPCRALNPRLLGSESKMTCPLGIPSGAARSYWNPTPITASRHSSSPHCFEWHRQERVHFEHAAKWAVQAPLSTPVGVERGWGIGREIRYCAYGTGASSYLTHSIDFSPAATWALYPSPIQSAICPNARRRGYVPTLNTRPNGLFRLPFSPRRGVKRGGGDKGGQRDSRRTQPSKSQAQNHKAPAWASSIQ